MEQEIGDKEVRLPDLGNASLILVIVQENSNAMSLSWSFNLCSFSKRKGRSSMRIQSASYIGFGYRLLF